MKTCAVLLLSIGLLPAVPPAGAQEARINSFYETGPGKEYKLKPLRVEGEVARPGTVDFGSLPLRSAAVKELAWEEGKPEFRGAYYFTGYSLYDILNARGVKKAREDFRPEVDLFVVVEGAAGEKAVFSWGEIYYARNGLNSLIYKSARSVTAPKRGKDWPLPEVSRLVCPDDLYNARFIAEPVKITVKSAPGDYPGEKHKAVYAPSFKVIYGDKSSDVAELADLAEKRSHVSAGYGHGTGFKGLKETDGWLLKDILARTAGIGPQDSGNKLLVVSSGDSYRAAFSLSEVLNRGDNADFLVADKGEEKDGRYSVLSASDFFVDRNVRAMAKAEILTP